MGVNAIIQLIATLIKYGPALISLVSEVIDLIRKLRGQEAEAFKVELKQAAHSYKANGDMRPLEALRDRLRKRCLGDCK